MSSIVVYLGFDLLLVSFILLYCTVEGDLRISLPAAASVIVVYMTINHLQSYPVADYWFWRLIPLPCFSVSDLEAPGCCPTSVAWHPNQMSTIAYGKAVGDCLWSIPRCNPLGDGWPVCWRQLALLSFCRWRVGSSGAEGFTGITAHPDEGHPQPQSHRSSLLHTQVKNDTQVLCSVKALFEFNCEKQHKSLIK